MKGEEIIVEVTRGSGLLSEEEIVKLAERATISPSQLAGTATAAAAAYVKSLAEEAREQTQSTVKLPPIGFLTLSIDKANRCRLKARFKPNPQTAFDPAITTEATVTKEKHVPLPTTTTVTSESTTTTSAPPQQAQQAQQGKRNAKEAKKAKAKQPPPQPVVRNFPQSPILTWISI